MSIARAVLVGAVLSGVGLAYELNAPLKDVDIKTTTNTASKIPKFGEAVLVLFYTDADEADLNDPLADALTASKIDVNYFEGIGVVNLADSKAPDFIIRAALNDKTEKYDSLMVTDPNRAIPTAWGLGDCNNTSVIVVVGKDKKLKYVGKGAIRGAELEKVVALVASLVDESKASEVKDAGAASP